jgi:hypothetical protein
MAVMLQKVRHRRRFDGRIGHRLRRRLRRFSRAAAERSNHPDQHRKISLP